MAAEPGALPGGELADALAAAWDLAQGGDPDAAIARFESLAREYPEAADPPIDLGICYAAQGRFGDAATALRRGLAIDSERDDAHYNLGIALEQEGDAAAAAECYVRALGLNGTFLEAGMRLGAVLEAAGDSERAFHAYLRIGMAIAGSDRAASAVPPLAAAVRLNPDATLACYGLGNALLAAGQFGPAREALSRAVELETDFAEAHNSLGLAHYHAGDTREARRCFEAALKRKTIFPAARNNLGNCYARDGKHDEAVRQYRFAVNQSPNYAEAQLNAAQELHMLGRLDEAARACEAALEIQPHNALAHTTLAWILLSRGEFERGWREFEWRVSAGQSDGYLPHPLDRARSLPRPSTLLPLDLEGRDVAIIGTGGLGTELFFLRFVPALRARGVASISYLTDQRLRPLVERTAWFNAVDDLERAVQRDYDVLLSGCELPLVLGHTGGNVDERTPRITPTGIARETIAVRLGAAPDPILAVTWRAGIEGDGPRRKQVALDQLAHAVSAWPGRVVSVQRGATAGELETFAGHLDREVEDFGDVNDDLELALALFERVADYVGVSNTNMYLAAAAGRTARVLVKRPLEWRWSAGRNGDAYWFPGFSLYPETTGGGWDAALSALRRDLDPAAAVDGD